MREIKLTLHKSLLSVSQTIFLYIVLLITIDHFITNICKNTASWNYGLSLIYVCILYSSAVQ